MMRFALVFLLLFVWMINAAVSPPKPKNVTKIVDVCVPAGPPYGDVCVKADSFDCFGIKGAITMSSIPVYEGSWSLPTLLRALNDALEHPKPGSPQNIVCYPIRNVTRLGQCDACLNVTDFKLNGNDFHFCGNLTVNCSTVAGAFSQSFAIPCFNVSDCKLFGCPNNCSHQGQCDQFGFCECSGGHYGPDCSASVVNGTCIASSFFPTTCWHASFPDCHTVDFEVDADGHAIQKFQQTLSSSASLVLVPCKSVGALNNPCEVCVVAQNVQVVKDELRGCPVVSVRCQGLEVENFPLSCITLAKSDRLVCANTPPSTPPKGDNNVNEDPGAGKIIMWLVIGVAVLAVLAGGAYFVFVRYIRRKRTVAYQGIPTTGGDENGGEDAEEEGALKSPFAASSDEDDDPNLLLK